MRMFAQLRTALAARTVSARIRRAERQRGPEAFPAGPDEVGGDLSEERIGRLHRFPQRGVHADEVVRERRQVEAFLKSLVAPPQLARAGD